jgi:uncharacterized membrane protein SirB2
VSGSQLAARRAQCRAIDPPGVAVLLLIKHLHVALALLTAVGFVARGVLAFADSQLRNTKWMRIAPHVIDTVLLACGITLAVQLSLSPLANGWLMSKILGLLAYIGFGVMTMRAGSRPLQLVGFVGAIASVSYIFAVAYTKQVLPL